MIRKAQCFEIRCDGCGKRWGEEQEPEIIEWDTTPEGIAARFREVEDSKDPDQEKWWHESERPVGGAPAVITFYYCPDCQTKQQTDEENPNS